MGNDALHFDFNRVAVQGDDHEIQMTFADEAGTPVDITSWDFYYTAKSDLAIADADAEIYLDPTDFTKSDSGGGTTDTINFILPAATTAAMAAGNYHQDIQRILAGSPITLGLGKLVLLGEVTKRTAPVP